MAAGRARAMVVRMRHPNILWIVSDQQRFDMVGHGGNPLMRTPHLDALAAAGAHCATAICQNTLCSPSRASFLTGRYPRTTRLRTNGQAIASDEILLPRLFRDAGWLCGLVGKLHLAPCQPSVCPGMERRFDDGYEVLHWSHHPSYDRANDSPANAYSAWLRSRGVELRWRSREDCPRVCVGPAVEDHHTTWCIERAMAFVDDADAHSRPWFLSINLFDPHHPFDPPAEMLAPYLGQLDRIPLPCARSHPARTPWEAEDRVGAYGGRDMPGSLPDNEHRLVRAASWAMCDLIDAQLGRLFARLRAIGAWEDTVVVYCSDHGELLGDHGMYLKGPHFYEGAVRVPLVIAGPGMPRMRIDEPVELVDIAPTLCALAGIAAPAGMQGRSLMPRITGAHSSHRDDAYCEFLGGIHRNEAHATMVRTRRHKLVRFHGPHFRSGLLYDLQEDPVEAVDRWDDPACLGVRAELLGLLADRSAMTFDPLPPRVSDW